MATGGGGMVRACFGQAKFGEGNFWYKILNTMEKCGTKFPNNRQFRKWGLAVCRRSTSITQHSTFPTLHL